MANTKPDVLLVGSVPRESAEEVFKTCSAILGDHLQALPDGEVGVRKTWIQCQAIGVFDKHPAIETVRRPQSADVDGLATDYTDNWIFRVRPGIHALELATWATRYGRLTPMRYFANCGAGTRYRTRCAFR